MLLRRHPAGACATTTAPIPSPDSRWPPKPPAQPPSPRWKAPRRTAIRSTARAGSIASNSSSARSKSSRSMSASTTTGSALSNSSGSTPPPRLRDLRRRASSTSTRRITCAAAPKKYAGPAHCVRFSPTSRRNVSCTRSRRLQRQSPRFTGKMAAGENPQLLVHRGDRFLERTIVSLAPLAQQTGDVRHAADCLTPRRSSALRQLQAGLFHHLGHRPIQLQVRRQRHQRRPPFRGGSAAVPPGGVPRGAHHHLGFRNLHFVENISAPPPSASSRSPKPCPRAPKPALGRASGGRVRD